jgi:predicted PurR-regulated permease PerM
MLHDKDKLKQTIFILALFLLGGILYWYLKAFLSPLLGAIIIYIVVRRPFFYLTEKAKKKWPVPLAALLMMFASFLVIVLPILLLSFMLSNKVAYVILHYNDILNDIQKLSEQAKDYLGINLLTPDTVSRLTTFAANVVPKIISATANVVIDILIIYLFLYFMITNARKLEAQVRRYLPFKEENNLLLVHELKTQTISNSIGIPALAVVQAGAALIGYLIFGAKDPWFWAGLTGLLSFIPVFGVGIAWLSVSALLFFSGNHWMGIGLFIYCIIIITAIDNGFRIVVQKRLGDIHPLITFFGVILGLDLFGFVGIIFGPLLISYFILLVRIYRNEYLEEEYETEVVPE